MNYQLVLEETIKKLVDEKIRPKLLLHSCCAPCSTYVLEYLNKYFDITIFYYNPNIDSMLEYQRRVSELNKFLTNAQYQIKLIVEKYDSEPFKQISVGLENESENGMRCFLCYELRLEETIKKAQKENFDYFTTTLSISPYKNAKKINEIGDRLSKKYNLRYLFADFKKQSGYKKSVELSKKYNLYRQNYCGCIYSKLEMENRKVNR